MWIFKVEKLENLMTENLRNGLQVRVQHTRNSLEIRSPSQPMMVSLAEILTIWHTCKLYPFTCKLYYQSYFTGDGKRAVDWVRNDDEKCLRAVGGCRFGDFHDYTTIVCHQVFHRVRRLSFGRDSSNHDDHVWAFHGTGVSLFSFVCRDDALRIDVVELQS